MLVLPFHKYPVEQFWHPFVAKLIENGLIQVSHLFEAVLHFIHLESVQGMQLNVLLFEYVILGHCGMQLPLNKYWLFKHFVQELDVELQD